LDVALLRTCELSVLTHSIVMDEWQLDDQHDIVVALINYEGRWRVDARVWLREDGALRPGKGLALGVKHLERLADAIEKTRRGAAARFLIKPKESAGADAA
jgi:hypothetical protein